MQYNKHEKQCFITRWNTENDAKRRIFDELQGVSSRDETPLLMLDILLNKYSLHRGFRSSDDDPSTNTKPVIGKNLVFSVDFSITRKRSLHPQKQKRKQTNNNSHKIVMVLLRDSFLVVSNTPLWQCPHVKREFTWINCLENKKSVFHQNSYTHPGLLCSSDFMKVSTIWNASFSSRGNIQYFWSWSCGCSGNG